MAPNKVHLVGSIGLNSVEEVFKTVGGLLGRRLRRIPDGEPGSRRLWIGYQYPFLRAQAFLKPDASAPNTRGFPPLMLAENVNAADIQFGELGYAREARVSYQDFLAALKLGQLPADVRFQVSLPTPMAVIGVFGKSGPRLTAPDLTFDLRLPVPLLRFFRCAGLGVIVLSLRLALASQILVLCRNRSRN